MADRVTDVGPSLVIGVSQVSISEVDAGYMSPPVVLSTTTSLLVRHQAEAAATAAPSATPTQAPTPEATDAATPEPEAQAAYFTYTIQPGDSVSSIATSFGVRQEYIVWNNPLVRDDPDLLIIGADILIPSVNGVVYTVTLGDTLSDIASYYQIDIQSITAFLPNRLDSADSVIEGMVLVLPGAVPPPPPIPAAVEVFEEPPVAAAAGGASEAEAEVQPEPEYVPPYTSSGFIWPFYASISQYFSGYHRGLDIDGFGAYGATIVAAADGVVVLASGQEWGYGNHVIIEHADGSRTLYAHLSEIWVGQGEYVGQGQGIGALGSTGYSTGPHLHFEIHIGGPVDPLAYLP